MIPRPPRSTLTDTLFPDTTLFVSLYISGGVGEDTIVFISNGGYSESGFCWNLFSWERNLGALAEHFRVVAFDTLGQGGTDAPTGEIRFTYDLVVEHARRFLEVLGIKQAHIVEIGRAHV